MAESAVVAVISIPLLWSTANVRHAEQSQLQRHDGVDGDCRQLSVESQPVAAVVVQEHVQRLPPPTGNSDHLQPDPGEQHLSGSARGCPPNQQRLIVVKYLSVSTVWNVFVRGGYFVNTNDLH